MTFTDFGSILKQRTAAGTAEPFHFRSLVQDIPIFSIQSLMHTRAAKPDAK